MTTLDRIENLIEGVIRLLIVLGLIVTPFGLIYIIYRILT